MRRMATLGHVTRFAMRRGDAAFIGHAPPPRVILTPARIARTGGMRSLFRRDRLNGFPLAAFHLVQGRFRVTQVTVLIERDVT